jgi:hypothetical protein
VYTEGGVGGFVKDPNESWIFDGPNLSQTAIQYTAQRINFAGKEQDLVATANFTTFFVEKTDNKTFKALYFEKWVSQSTSSRFADRTYSNNVERVEGKEGHGIVAETGAGEFFPYAGAYARYIKMKGTDFVLTFPKE